MDRRTSKDSHLRDIAERSQFWDADDLMRNFDRELAQLEHGLGHMVWDIEEHYVTIHLRPLPITPSFRVSDDGKEFRLIVRLPGVSKDDIRLSIDKARVELFACSGDAVCRPFVISVDAEGELAPESADAKMSGDVLEISVKRALKRRLEIK